MYKRFGSVSHWHVDLRTTWTDSISFANETFRLVNWFIKKLIHEWDANFIEGGIHVEFNKEVNSVNIHSFI